MKKPVTIMIEDSGKQNFRLRLNEVLARYPQEDIFSIDNGIYVDENVGTVYYSIIVVYT